MSKPVPLETTLHVRDHCLCLHAQQAARALSRRFDAAFRPLGISSGQYSLMHVLNQPEPPGMVRIAAFLAMDRTTLTANLKPLERRGLVTIAPDPEDRRGRQVRLTEAGQAVLARAVPIWVALHAEIEAGLPEGCEDLRAGMQTLVRTMDS